MLQVVGVVGDHADAQDGGDALGGEFGSAHAVVKSGVHGPQVVAELLAERRQPYRAGAAVEQRSADLAFLFLDGLGDPGRGDVQPGGSTREVQFLGQGQEDLDVAQLHGPPNSVNSEVNPLSHS